MKRVALLTAVLLLPVLALAQGSSKQDQTIRRIIETSASIESLSCDFTQVREVAILSQPDISKGQLQYRNDGRILWRYTSPSAYQVAFTKDAMVITRNGQTQNMSLSDNPYLGQLRELLLGIMSGSQLVRDGRFQVTITQYEPEIVMSMVPVMRQVKKLFKEMTISFTSKDCLVSKVVLTEADGNSTTISFTNRKMN